MDLSGEYEPSALGWVREQVEQIVGTGTTDGVTIKGSPVVLMTYRGAKTGKLRRRRSCASSTRAPTRAPSSSGARRRRSAGTRTSILAMLSSSPPEIVS